MRHARGTAEQPVPGVSGDHIPSHINEQGRAVADEEGDPKKEVIFDEEPDELNNPIRGDKFARQMYVTKASLKRFGRTQGCPACGDSRTPHNTDCRARIRTILAEYGVGQTKLAEEEARVSIRVAQGMTARNEGNVFE